MNFESIIGLIIFLAISSLFNRSKEKNKGPEWRRTGSPSSPYRKAAERTGNMKLEEQQKKRLGSNQKKKVFTNLESWTREFKTDFESIFGDSRNFPAPLSKKVEDVNMDIIEKSDGKNLEVYEEAPTVDALTEGLIEKKSIYENEIGKEDQMINFNRKSIIQGIIISEILSKPKCRR